MVVLPGSLLASAMGRMRRGPGNVRASQQSQAPERQRQGSLDPQTIAEFLAYDIPFATPPAVAFTFPADVRRG
jgi:hypothetical protein